jgi:hypothetical protein
MTDPFEGLPVIGAMAEEAAVTKLVEIGVPVVTRPGIGVSFSTLDFLPWRRRLWAGTNHLFGYLPPTPAGGEPIPVRGAGEVSPDRSLAGARVRITIDRLRVAQYPGGGTHRVLFDFSARNSAAGEPADLHFNAVYRVREGESAGIAGYPVFDGLKVGPGGIALRCYTVNVRNDRDEAVLSALEGDAFKAGLALVKAAQPALAPLSALAIGLTRSVAGRSRNVPVQDFSLGLDFGSNLTGARLVEGSYLAAQVPDDDATGWDWGRWAYDPRTGRVADADGKPLPYNYIILGVSRCAEG